MRLCRCGNEARSGQRYCKQCHAENMRERRAVKLPTRKYEKHGHTVDSEKSPTYLTWSNMVARCYEPKNGSYADYGAKGITVCDRWRYSFKNFLEDMGERPTGKTIDRYPNSAGNYDPGNCRWATPLEQMLSSRKSKPIEFNGERLTIRQWAIRLGLSHQALIKRLRKWPLEKALKTC